MTLDEYYNIRPDPSRFPGQNTLGYQQHRQFCFHTTSSEPRSKIFIYKAIRFIRGIKKKTSPTDSGAPSSSSSPLSTPKSLFTLVYMLCVAHIIFITLLIQSTYTETRVKTPGTFFFPQPRDGIITPSNTQQSWVRQARGPP